MGREQRAWRQLDGKLGDVGPTYLQLLRSVQIGLLISSASIISTSVYFLWRITTFPEISNVDAILIGVAITTAIFLGGWGIVSARGNPVESSLLVQIPSPLGCTQLTVPVRLCDALHLPDLHRLPALVGRSCCSRHTL